MQKRAGPKNIIFVISDQGAIHPYGSYPGRRTFVQMQYFARVLERLRLKKDANKSTRSLQVVSFLIVQLNIC